LILSIGAALVCIPFWYFWAPDNLGRLFSGVTDRKIQILIGFGYRTLYQAWMFLSATMFATILISIATTIKGKRILTPLAAFGQMALSNYLIQSIFLVPYLLITDKIKGIGPTEGLITFVIVFALQLIFSQWWMSKYKLGPFEWLLRSFTYWKWQSLKKTPQNEFDEEKQMITVSSPQFL
jgi:uncharacterized membrane protein YeiB